MIGFSDQSDNLTKGSFRAASLHPLRVSPRFSVRPASDNASGCRQMEMVRAPAGIPAGARSQPRFGSVLRRYACPEIVERMGVEEGMRLDDLPSLEAQDPGVAVRVWLAVPRHAFRIKVRNHGVAVRI